LIEVDTPCLKGWCCLDEDNVWEIEEMEPPCEVCPRANYTLSPRNERLVRCWRMLDLTGRDRMWEAGFLREEAIDVALTRYQLNSPQMYERLIYVDIAIVEHRQANKPKETKNTK
jgi:hypothetical protein